MEVTRSDLQIIKGWIQANDYTRAGTALSNFLADNPDDMDAWFLMGTMLLHQDNPALARMIFDWTTGKGGAEDRWEHWLNLGKAWDHLNLADEAEEFYRRALMRAPSNDHVLASLGTNLVQQYRSDEALDYCQRAVDANPDNKMAVSSMGFAHIQKREWAKGWDCYEYGYGKLRWRKERLYTGEGRWDGTPGQRIIVHGEQGIGDQIAGLEPLADMAEATTVLAVEVDKKIAPLVARSYPDLEVHGTLKEKDLDWPLALEPDAHCGLFSMHRHFRRQESDYRGKAYLKADPDRSLMWRALLDSLGPEPKVGLAWSGGISLTQSASRRANLLDWLPILKQPCHWISLEYRDRSDELANLKRQRGITVHDWPWATQTDNYDDTAPLVAELDLIITVPTSVVHLAGALGTPCLCMTHPRPNLHYCGVGDTIAYYGDTVRLYRRESNDEWAGTVAKVADTLTEILDARAAA